MKVIRLTIFELIMYIIISIIISFFATKELIDPIVIQKPTKPIIVIKEPDETINYLQALRACEADGRYQASNGSYDGGYQLGRLAKTEVGYAILHNKEGKELFLKDSLLQEEVMIRLLQSQLRLMKPYIQRYANTNIGNYWITTSGVVAMSHLCGPDATIKFLTSRGKNISFDGNKVDMTRYLQFNNFHLPIDSILQPSYVNNHLMKFLKR